MQQAATMKNARQRAHFGIEAVYQLRQRMGLSRRTCVVGAVGAGFVLGEGIRPGRLAK